MASTLPPASATVAGFDVARFARSFDPHAPEYWDHFPAIYARLREHDPVAWTPAHGGMWVLTRYDDVARAAADDRTFSSTHGFALARRGRPPAAPQPRISPAARLAHSAMKTRWIARGSAWLGARLRPRTPSALPIQADPPRSTKYRRLLNQLFEPGAMRAMEPELRRLATRLVDGFIEVGSADLVEALARPLTGIVTVRLAGLPEEDWALLADSMGPAGTSEASYSAGSASVRGLIDDAIRKARHAPASAAGALGTMVRARVDGRSLEDWEIRAVLNNLLQGGFETTRALLGSAWIDLGRNPERRRRLTDDPACLAAALEEFLRVYPPGHALYRTAAREVTLHGKTIRPGERVLLCWASANRDPAKFDDPEAVRLDRADNPHLSLGHGSHYCVGAPLARLEALACLREVLDRLPSYTLVEEGVKPYPPGSDVFGYRNVPVRFAPGPRRAA